MVRKAAFVSQTRMVAMLGCALAKQRQAAVVNHSDKCYKTSLMMVPTQKNVGRSTNIGW
jgi:hypothetical protein